MYDNGTPGSALMPPRPPGKRRSTVAKVVGAVALTLVLIGAIVVAFVAGRSSTDGDRVDGGSGDTNDRLEADASGGTEGADDARPSLVKGSRVASGPRGDVIDAPDLGGDYTRWETKPQRIAALPEPTEWRDGFATGFPHSELGAVAYLIYANEAYTSTEEERLVDALRAYFSIDEINGDTYEQAAQLHRQTMLEWSLAQGFDGPDTQVQAQTYGFAATTLDNGTVLVSRVFLLRMWDGETNYLSDTGNSLGGRVGGRSMARGR